MCISRVFSSNDLSRKTRLIKSKYSACVPAVNAFLSSSLFSLAPAVAPSLLQMHPLVAKKKKQQSRLADMNNVISAMVFSSLHRNECIISSHTFLTSWHNANDILVFMQTFRFQYLRYYKKEIKQE